MKNKKTIADLEAEQGTPDKLRKLSGKNVRSDMHVDNFKKLFDDQFENMTEPEEKPESITINYKGHALILEGEKLKKAVIALHLFGII